MSNEAPFISLPGHEISTCKSKRQAHLGKHRRTRGGSQSPSPRGARKDARALLHLSALQKGSSTSPPAQGCGTGGRRRCSGSDAGCQQPRVRDRGAGVSPDSRAHTSLPRRAVEVLQDGSGARGGFLISPDFTHKRMSCARTRPHIRACMCLHTHARTLVHTHFTPRSERLYAPASPTRSPR